MSKKLEVVWHSKYHGQRPPSNINYKTEVLHDGYYYCYNNSPATIKAVWDAEADHEWEETKYKGRAFMTAETETL